MCDNEDASDNSDDEGILKKCLDVELPKNFDPNKIPENGIEYIQWVMYETKKLKKCVKAEIDSNKIKREPTVQIESEVFVKAAPPSEDWQEMKLNKFLEFRKHVQSHMKDSPTKHTIHRSHWENKLNTTYPAFEEVADLTQDSKLTLLTIIIDQLERIEAGASIGQILGTWIYALLTTFEIPLSPDICHELRNLSRKCAQIRSKLPKDAPNSDLNPLNVFIYIIALYYKQLDLRDT